MIDLVAQSPQLRLIMLVLLFALVVISAFFIAQGIASRQLVRRRMLEASGSGGGALMTNSLRTERVESAWLKLVNSIEHKGISLVDTRDAKLRQRLIAAGFTATYAPRVYTLIRLVAVIALMGSSPSMLNLYFSLVIAAAMGLYIPSLYVRARADRRQREIVNGFP